MSKEFVPKGPDVRAEESSNSSKGLLQLVTLDLAQEVAVPASGLELVCAVSIESVNGNPTFATHTRRCGRCDKKLLSALQEGTMLLEHFREGTMRYLPDSNEWVRRG